MLTPKQKQILEYLKKCLKKNKYSPSLEEIGKHFKLAKSTVHEHIGELKEKGYLKKADYKARSIKLSQNKKSGLVKIPLLGTIAAGQPIEAIQNTEAIAVPQNKLPRSGEFYALRVFGNSMIDENINDGDIVLVKQQSIAENGQKVVALIDNHEATLKKYYREKGHIRLQPANKNMEPIILRGDRDISIQGIVLDVIRDSGSSTSLEVYPDTKLLNRERKVKNREAKEKLRGGTKFRKNAIFTAEVNGIKEFINKIICGDSEEVLRKIPTGPIDIIIFPPYRFKLNHKDNAGKVYRSEYFKK